MKKVLALILILSPTLLLAQEPGGAWDMITAAIGAAVGMIVYAAKDLLVAVFELWTAKIRGKMPPRND